MKCPRTGTDLEEVEIDGVKIDISRACGGVWFDNLELKKFDEAHESAGAALAELMAQYGDAEIDMTQRLRSPRHPEVVMMRHYYSPARKVEIDECPMCGGIWLDAGELAKIRKMYPTEAARKKAGKELVASVLEEAGALKILEESREKRAKAARIAKLFRWLAPGGTD